jgi:hypothetical protein
VVVAGPTERVDLAPLAFGGALSTSIVSGHGILQPGWLQRLCRRNRRPGLIPGGDCATIDFLPGVSNA